MGTLKEVSSPNRPLGVALPVVLMFLLVITILGVLGVRRAITGETLSRNQLDYEVARQAAEAALRDGERDLTLGGSALYPNALCARGNDRPLDSSITASAPFFDTNCARGQCRFAMSYYTGSNYGNAPAVLASPQPWWPDAAATTTTPKGGLWGAVATKPSVAAGVGTNCVFNGSVPLGTFTGTARLAGVARQPEYIIEYLAINPVTMRVTARGFGANINTEVVMQSYFQPFINN